MKKNMVVILIVIGVIGAVVYLLKDKLEVLLGKRVEREEIGEGQMDPYIRHERLGPLNEGVYKALPVGPMIELRQFDSEAAAVELLGADVIGFIRTLYPSVFEHRPILLRLKAYLTGQPVTVQLPRIPTTKPYIAQLDPYIRHERLGPLSGPVTALPVGPMIELR